MGSELLGLIFLNVLLLVAGGGLLVLAGWSSLQLLRAWIGLAYLAGAAWVGMVGTLLLVMGLSFGRVAILIVAATPPLLAGVAARVQWRAVRAESPRATSYWAAVPALAVTALVLVKSAFQPLSAWDAWSFWTPKAESLVYADGLDRAFLQSGVLNANYPPLVPVIESAAFRFMDTFDTTLVHVQFALLFVAFVCAVGELSRRSAPRLTTAVVLVLVAASPALYRESASGLADVPVAILGSVGALLLWQGLREGGVNGALPLATLFLTAAMLTKVEGIIFVAAIAVSLLVVLRHDTAARRRLFVVGIAAGAVAIVPWQLWLRANDIRGDYRFAAEFITSEPGRFLDALASLATSLASPARWLLLPVVVVMALLVGLAGKRRPEAQFVIGTLALSVLALDLVYWGTSYPFAWHLGTSAARVTTTPFLIAAAFTPALMGSVSLLPSRWSRPGLDPAPAPP